MTMMHFLLPYLRPMLYYSGLRYLVYRENRAKALSLYSLWFITPPFVFAQILFRNFGERTTYAMIHTPDLDYSVLRVVTLMIAWPYLWMACGRIGDRLFLQRNKWAKYGQIPLNRARRLQRTVKMPEWF